MSRRKGTVANPICSPSCELRPIPGFPDYFAGADGNIYSEKHTGIRMMSGGLSEPCPGNIYYSHRLSVDLRPVTVMRHVLIALAFHGPRPEGLVIDHIDGNGLNNLPGNLRYVTPKVNSNNPASKTHDKKLTKHEAFEIKRMLLRGYSQREIAAEYGISQCNISQIRTGRIRADIPWPATVEAENPYPAPRQSRGEGEAA